MVQSLLQTVFSLPGQVAGWLLCWPWRNARDVDGKSVASESTAAEEQETPVRDLNSLEYLQAPLPRYAKWLDEHFAISEYDSKDEHFIDLTSYPLQDRLMAKALGIFGNRRPDYADPDIPYELSLTLEEALVSLRRLVEGESDFRWTKREYYIVAYYSTLRAGLQAEDRKRLAALDEAAFREALPSKAFIKYWFGKPDQFGRNLATCQHLLVKLNVLLMVAGVWTNRTDAKRTLANGPYHRRAASDGQGLYQKGTIDIREYSLTINEDVNDWSIDLISKRIHA
ncbi:MAG: hypothetical protein GOMPHAMPRED_001896 [Gomphillus americanus]|uniref:Uncharacterized protein n=1 Tax=Gomphillus americanus TaxID=1940652 RepID=A0A8H3F5Q4_9LECA|nr:MAG: hypothetical protein GOMPHAMPRED_001896 [Gomphillus americanus]